MGAFNFQEKYCNGRKTKKIIHNGKLMTKEGFYDALDNIIKWKLG